MNTKNVGTIKTTFNLTTKNMDKDLPEYVANMTMNNPIDDFNLNNPNDLELAKDGTNKSFKVRRKI